MEDAASLRRHAAQARRVVRGLASPDDRARILAYAGENIIFW